MRPLRPVGIPARLLPVRRGALKTESGVLRGRPRSGVDSGVAGVPPGTARRRPSAAIESPRTAQSSFRVAMTDSSDGSRRADYGPGTAACSAGGARSTITQSFRFPTAQEAFLPHLESAGGRILDDEPIVADHPMTTVQCFGGQRSRTSRLSAG